MEDIPLLVQDETEEIRVDLEVDASFDKDPLSKVVDRKDKVPISIITGYLGSGKSTLLDQIAKRGEKKLAVILNEFGDSSDIEKAVSIKDGSRTYEEWLDLGNGCLCCTVKDNGVAAIERLVSRKDSNFDYILLETTGVADPAPIASMFWLDEGLSSNVYIDGVITVLDAEHILTSLDDVGGHWHKLNNHVPNEKDTDLKDTEDKDITTAHLQLALADVILLNKIDRIDTLLKPKIIDRIKSVNSIAPIHETKFGDIDLDKILDLHAYESKGIEDLALQNSSFHDPRISTICLKFPLLKTEQFDQIEKFLQFILWESLVNNKIVEIHRTKGILIDQDKSDIRVVQGVRQTYDIIKGAKLENDLNVCKLVLIGKNLNSDDLIKEFLNFLPFEASEVYV